MAKTTVIAEGNFSFEGRNFFKGKKYQIDDDAAMALGDSVTIVKKAATPTAGPKKNDKPQDNKSTAGDQTGADQTPQA